MTTRYSFRDQIDYFPIFLWFRLGDQPVLLTLKPNQLTHGQVGPGSQIMQKTQHFNSRKKV